MCQVIEAVERLDNRVKNSLLLYLETKMWTIEYKCPDFLFKNLFCPMDDPLLNIGEAARHLGVSIKTLRRWEKSGKLSAQRSSGKHRRYLLSELDFLKNLSKKSKSNITPKFKPQLINIGEASQHLGVSIKTLRRWEKAGRLVPQRSSGKHRRYDFFHLEKLKSESKNEEKSKIILHEAHSVKALSTISSIKIQANDISFNKKMLLASSAFLVLGLSFIFIFSHLLIGGSTSKIAHQTEKSDSILASLSDASVLGSSTRGISYILKINAPTTFSESATFSADLQVNGLSNLFGGVVTDNQDVNAGTGKLTASNVIYTITAGSGLSSTGGQNPILTNTGVTSFQGSTGAVTLTGGGGITINGSQISNSDGGSAQNIFKNISVNSSIITAGSNTDTLTFAEGSGITLSADTTNKKITITSSASSTGSASLWAQTNGALYPVNSTVDLLIGGQSTASADFAVLNVNGNGPATATVSGNLIVMPKNGAGGRLGVGTTTPNNGIQVANLINFDNSLQSTALGYQSLNSNNALFNTAVGYQALFSNTTGVDNFAGGTQALFNNTSGGSNIAILDALYNNDSGSNNIALGSLALSSNLTGNNNIGLGTGALYANTNGNDNIALGNSALGDTSGGDNNIALGAQALQENGGTNNIALGAQALFNSTGSDNFAAGYQALTNNDSGIQNIAIGNSALKNNSGGQDNFAAGYQALYNNTSGTDNFAAGYKALNQTDANNNIGIGNSALGNAVSGDNNIALGPSSLLNNSGEQNIGLGQSSLANNQGFDNVGIGEFTLSQNTSGNLNIAIGGGTLGNNTEGNFNVGIGNEPLGANTTGSNNIGIGSSAGSNITTGTDNIALGTNAMASGSNNTGGNNFAAGNQALYQNTTGNFNVALGYQTLRDNTTGTDNIAIGDASLNLNTTGGENIALGVVALESNISGFDNIALGIGSLNLNTTGSNNIGIGSSAGENITTGSHNIVIGASVDVASATADNQLVIGNLIFGTGLDGTGTTISSGKIGIGINSPLATLHVNATSGTTAVASVSGRTSFASLVVDQSGVGDIFAASASGKPIFTVGRGGLLTDAAYTNAGGILYTSTTGLINQTTVGTSSQCLLGGATPTFGSCSTGSSGSPFSELLGAIIPNNSTEDFLIGGSATTSAKFAVLGIANSRGTQTASLSGSLVFDSSTASIQNTKNQLLTIGGNTTGDIALKPLNGSGNLALSLGGITVNGTPGVTQGSPSCVTTVNGIVVGTGTCQLGSEQWVVSNGTIYPGVPTLDLLIGGSSTTSAKFAFINNALSRGNQIASISGSVTLDSSTASIQNTNNQLITIGGNTTGDIQFKPGNSSSSLYLSSTGKVGIGTTTPSETLEVNGNIKGNAFKPTAILANGASGSDSIFELAGGNILLDNNTALRFKDSGGTGFNAIFVSSANNVQYNTPASGGSLQFQVLNSTGTLQFFTNSTQVAIIDQAGRLGLNTTSPLATLDVRPNTTNGGTTAVASISGNTSFASLVVDKTGNNGDIFAASAAGKPIFTVGRGGLLTDAAYTNAGGILYTSTSGLINQTGVGSSSQCLLGGSTPVFGACSSGTTTSPFNDTVTAGTITENNTTEDLLIGGISSSSAKFAFLNNNLARGNQVASISGGLTLDSSVATIAATNNQLLTIGGSTTGDINLSALNGRGTVNIIADLSQGARSTDVLSINQTNNASNNSTGHLLTLSNSDTGSTASLLSVSQANAAGLNGISVGGNNNTGTAINITEYANISGSIGLAFINSGGGNNIQFTNAADTTSGKGISIEGSNSGTGNSFSGSYLSINPSRTFTGSGSRNDTGNFINAARSNTVNNAGATFTISGDLVALSSNCTKTSGECIDTSNVLSLTQSYASASGSVLRINNGGSGIGLNLFGNGGTNPAASISAKSSFATLALDQLGLGDIFTASKSGSPRFTIAGNGSITANAYLNAGGILYTSTTGLINQTAAGTSSQCLLGGSTPAFGSCLAGTSSSPFNDTTTAGTITQNNTTEDLLIGGISSSSALFRVTGSSALAGTTSVASIAAHTSFAALVIDQTGNGDLFTASASGNPVFVIAKNGNLGLGGTTIPSASIDIKNSATGTGINFQTASSGTGISFPGQWSGTGIKFANSGGGSSSLGTNGVGIDLGHLVGTGIGISMGGTGGVGGNAFTGTYLKIVDDLTYNTATIPTVTGNFINASRTYNTQNNVINIIGDLATLTSTCGGANCVDTSNILRLTQNYNKASGAVLNIVNNSIASAAAILSNSGGQAVFQINNLGVGAMFTASASGVSKFTIENSGALTDAAYTNAGGILYTSTTGLIGQTGAGTSSQCLLGGSTPAFGACSTGTTTSPFNDTTTAGTITENNTTEDLLIGGISSSSALFRVTGKAAFAGTTSVASIAANTSFAAMVIDQTGVGDLFTASASGNPLFTIKKNGNVGILSSNPQGSLQIGSGQILVPGGTKTAPDIALSSRTNTGLYFGTSGGDSVVFSGNGTPKFFFQNASNRGFVLSSDIPLSWVSTTDATSVAPDVYLSRSAVGVLRISNDAGNGSADLVVNGGVGIGTTSRLATLDVRPNTANGGTIAVASISGNTSFASLVVDKTGNNGDILAASASGLPIFTVGRGGLLTDAAYTNAGGILYTSTTGLINQTAVGTSSQCLLGGSTPAFGACSTGTTTSPFNDTTTAGTITQNNTTEDLLIGGTSTASADFAVLNVNGTGPVTATVSGNLIVMPKNGGGGLVGIGTIAPTVKLAVQGSNSETTVGSEKITASADRNFSSDTGKWTTTGSPPWKINIASSGLAAKDAPGTGALTLNNTALDAAAVAGNSYKISFDYTTTATSSASDGIFLSFGGQSSNAFAIGSNQSSTLTTVITAANTGGFIITPSSAWYGTIDNVSIKQITPTNSLVNLLNSDGTTGLELRSGGSGLSNTFIGQDVGKYITAGFGNVALGYSALGLSTGGGANVAIGVTALKNNTGDYNIGLGNEVLYYNTSGSSNIALGNDALLNNTTGSANIALGERSLGVNSQGYNNIALGPYALGSNTSGYDNLAFGTDALGDNTTGHNNIGIGSDAGLSLTTGSNNIIIGNEINAPSATDDNQLSIANMIFGTDLSATGTDIPSGGAIGIGIAAPQATLDVHGDLRVQDASNVGSIIGSGTFLTMSNGKLSVNASGNVPQSELQIGQNSAPTSISSATTYLQLGQNESAANSYRLIGFGYAFNSLSMPAYIGYVTTDTTNYEKGDLIFGTRNVTTDTTPSERLRITTTGRVGIGTATPSATLDLRGNLATIPVASFSGSTNMASLVVDQTGNGDIFTASAAGLPLFKITKSGGIGVGSGASIGTSSQCLFGGATASWGTCTSGGSGAFNDTVTAGTITQNNTTEDLLIGGTSSSSALFRVTGSAALAGTKSVASISAHTSFAAMVIDQTGVGDLFTASASGLPLFTITKAGNVGIGTTLPAVKLAVQGTNSNATLGSEKITAGADRDFSSNTGKWTAPGGWTILGGVANKNAEGTGAFTLNNTALNSAAVVGSVYQITFDFTVTASSSGAIFPVFGGEGVSAVGDTPSSAGTQTQVVTAIDTSALSFNPDDGWYGTIDNVSIKQITPTNSLVNLLNSDGTTGLEIRSGGSGSGNTFLGYQSGLSNISGLDNTAVGNSTLLSNTTGLENTALGWSALLVNTTGSSNTAIGSQALRTNTTGQYNIALGAAALEGNTTGIQNVGIGFSSLLGNTTGSSNTAIGYTALSNNTSGQNNIGIGYSALSGVTTGSFNIGIGWDTMIDNFVTGTNNLALGNAALENLSSGINNVAIGGEALLINDVGSNNTALGYSAGGFTTGSGNVFLGYNAGHWATGDNQLYIANSETTNPLIYGDFAAQTLGINLPSTLTAGVPDNSPLATLDVRGSSGTTPIASFSGNTSFAAFVIDQSGSGPIFTASKGGTTKFVISNTGRVGIGIGIPLALLDVSGGNTTGRALAIFDQTGASTNALFTASASGITKFTIANGGAITDAAYNGQNGVLYGGFNTGVIAQAVTGSSGLCLISGASNPAWGSCSGSAFIGQFSELNGSIFQNNTTEDLLIGGQSTASAKFAFINMSGPGEPTASIAGQITLRNSVGNINRLNGGDITFQTSVGGDAGLAARMTIKNNGSVGIGTASPLATLDLRGNSGTTPIASISGKTSFATLVLDQTGVGDLFTASASGNTLFTIKKNGNVGIGTSNPVEKLQVSGGNVLIDSQTNTTAANMQTWTKLTGTAGTIGGSNTNIASISAAVVYNGSLYVGTNKADQAEVWRYDGPTLGTWTRVTQAAGTISSAGGATSNIDSISSMTVYNGYLYIGTTEPAKAEVYRYDGGAAGAWTQLNITGTAGKLNTQVGIDGVSAMGVFAGKLYIGTALPTKAQLYRYEGGTTWTIINTTAGTFVTTNSANVNAISSIVSYQGALYISTRKGGDADVLRYEGDDPGANIFVTMNLGSTTGSYSIAGSATTAFNDAILTVWDSRLIVGLSKANAAEVLYWNGSSPGLAANTSATNLWQRMGNAAGTISSAGGATTSIDGISAINTYAGRLYIGTSESNSAEIYRFDGNPGAWTKVTQNTAGSITAGGTGSIDAISTLISVQNNFLFAGTQEANSAEGYQYTGVIDQSYALKFRAGTAQGGGEQNSQFNTGSIIFVASSSANSNSTAGNTGNFVFSNGILTDSGAYDVAEDYPTRDDTLSAGDVVSMDPNEYGFVNKSSGLNDSGIIGVFSQDPALRLSQQGTDINGGNAVPIALAGRVPIKVSTESGEIKVGDYLTSSSTPGVAMKATGNVPVFAQAMEPYDGIGIGKVMSFIRGNTYTHDVFASVGDISMKGQDINFKNSKGESVITFDENGNAHFAGTITADKIKANSIEGLEILTDKISSLDASYATISAKLNSDNTGSINLKSLFGISADGTATVSGDLQVIGSSVLNGTVTALTSIMTPNLIVSDFATFFHDVVFKGNVIFDGRPTFNSDTAGTAVINKDSASVSVRFGEEYNNSPVVTASISLDSTGDSASDKQLEDLILNGNISYIVTNKSSKGFTIKLNKPAPSDLTFSWVALSVKDQKVQTSNSQNDSNPISTQSAAFQSIVNQLNNK